MQLAPFIQPPPRLENTWDTDRPLRSLLTRRVPAALLATHTPALRELGALSAGELFELQLADRLNEPTLTQWSPWGERIDRIEVSPLWRRAERIAAEQGLVATAYDRALGPYARLLQFARVYLFGPSSDIYTCPLAMTDGAARTLLASGHQALIDRAVPRLTSRDPSTFWTSGQWMTESTGGSDVGRSETVATPTDDGGYALWGRKWFTSATTSQMALTLARPEGNGPGGRGLALFYVELRDDAGRLRRIEVHRLKDKLGTRKVPTAELTLRGTPATPVCGLDQGVRAITPMLNVTRTWNAVSAAAAMRRSVALARDYARRRVAFGSTLSEKPLHLETLADLAAEAEAALHLTFALVARLGRLEAGAASDDDERLLRLYTPLAKLTTGKQAVAVASEALECFGGAGYVEDTGLPLLLRDAQVLSIWEGTTNVLALDALRALATGPDLAEALTREITSLSAEIADPPLRALADRAQGAVRRALAWSRDTASAAPLALEGGARRLALTLGRSLALLHLAHHADWSLRVEGDGRAAAAAARFALTPFDLLASAPQDDPRALALDEA